MSSVSYVSALSLWALVSGHWSAWQAARVEVEQMAEADELRENPIEHRVVEAIVEKTSVEPAGGAPLAPGGSSPSLDQLLTRLDAITAHLERIDIAGAPGGRS